MNGQHLGSLPSIELANLIGERWKSSGILKESHGPFVEDALLLLKDGIDLVTEADKALSNLLSYPLYTTLSSPECKAILEDGLSEVAASLCAAYDRGELAESLKEGSAGWKKWVKGFGKSVNRKGKSLFMPLRVLLTGGLQGPDMGSTVVLVYKAEALGAVAPGTEFVTLDQRFELLKEVDWASFQSNQPVLESAVN